MKKTRVVNIRKEKCDIYIGRPSIFGNPFKIGKDGDRRSIIEKYRGWFKAKLLVEPEFMVNVLKLKGKKLGCYCKPLNCHGDVIVEYLEND